MRVVLCIIPFLSWDPIVRLCLERAEACQGRGAEQPRWLLHAKGSQVSGQKFFPPAHVASSPGRVQRVRWPLQEKSASALGWIGVF